MPPICSKSLPIVSDETAPQPPFDGFSKCNSTKDDLAAKDRIRSAISFAVGGILTTWTRPDSDQTKAPDTPGSTAIRIGSAAATAKVLPRIGLPRKI